MISRIILFLVLLITFSSLFAQEKPELVDEFTQFSNDDLLARVDNLWIHLLHKNSNGFVFLSGTSLQKLINQRRIEGCNLARKYPQNTLKYILEEDSALRIQFWSVPKETSDPRFHAQPLNYELPDLDKPVELTNAAALEEYCPTRQRFEFASPDQGGNGDNSGTETIMLYDLYDQYFIDDLKNRADLVRIIQPYAQDLKKKGANWMACCPFHQEKTPSFSVNPSKGFYKCFGCGKGGTAFNFLMEMEGLSFPEAIKRVAEISGVMLPEPIDDRSYEINKKKKEEKKKLADEIIELNKIALDFWETELQSKNAKAKAAREYLTKRGISEDVQKAFHIGFSPDKWDGLLNVLREKNIDEKLIEQSGLVSVNEEKDRVFDRFRGHNVPCS